MPTLTDPNDGLVSFQVAMTSGEIRIAQCDLDPELFVHFDEPKAGVYRYSYFRQDGPTVAALAILIPAEPYDSVPCFQIGYAVPPSHQGRGLATATVKAAIAELHHGLRSAGVPRICVEAVIGKANVASLRVAQKTLADTHVCEDVDEASGERVYQYVGFFPPR